MNPETFSRLVEHLAALVTAERPLTAARLAPVQAATSSLVVRLIGVRMRGA
jgi:hypothetical protein